MNGLIPVTLYTDATPHFVVAIIPTLRMSFVQAFYIPEEINRVEAIAVLRLGLQSFRNVISVFGATMQRWSLHSPKGQEHYGGTTTCGAYTVLLQAFGRFTLTLHGLRNNTFEIQHISSANNLADRPSRAVLQTRPF